MKSRVLRLYEEGRIGTLGLANAVIKGWLTAEEYKEETGEDYVAPNPYGITEVLLSEIQDDTANEIYMATQEVEADE